MRLPRELLIDGLATSGRLAPARGEYDLSSSLLDDLFETLKAVTAEELRLCPREDGVEDTINVEEDYFVVLVLATVWMNVVTWAEHGPEGGGWPEE